MKLLFDQNISFRVIKSIEEIFQGSVQVKQAGLENKTDFEIWLYAKDYGFALVTFDSDFSDIANIKGFPPKIIWLRLSDQRTSVIVKKLIDKEEDIKAFGNDPEFGVLEIK